MRFYDPKAILLHPAAKIVLAGFGSLVGVAFLTYCVTAGGASAPATRIGLQSYLLMASGILLAGAAATAFWFAARRSRDAAIAARRESFMLRQNLSAAEAIIKAEPQILIHWDHARGLEVAAHTLAGVKGVPRDRSELLRFGRWLHPEAAAALKSGLDTLFAEGRAFNIILQTVAGDRIEADGRAAGGQAVLRLREISGYKRQISQIIEHQEWLARDIRSSRELLDALPMPVWLKGRDGHITWVNQAYAKAVDAENPSEVLQRQIELLESRQRKAVDRTLAKSGSYRDRMHLITGGERKAHDVVVLPLDDVIAGAAIDVAAIESAQGELDRQMAAYDRTLHRVASAIAIFNSEQQLTFFNEAFVKLWGLDVAWLETKPTDGSVLDRLREAGKLPEVVNYREWKSKWLTTYQNPAAREDWWHLPDGRIVHVVAEQRPDGGVTYLYGDETERLALESRYKSLISVQRETLDSLKEGVAVFATDGRLKLHNSAFASIWKLPRETLESGNPHVDDIIRLARVSYDDPLTWSRISRAVTSFSDVRETLEGQMVRPDQNVIDYASTPLPDGATLVTFADVTDSKRYERALVERNEALVAADRLKNQFIGHVSYELRTPLTNIIGFGEFLASLLAGPLNAKQQEYLGDITTSSKTLLSIIDDILDIATIDAGALELKLAPVGVQQVIDDALYGVRDQAMRTRLTFDIATAEDAVSFVADEARVRQVIYNLLANAVGFSKRGDTVHITCWREAGHMIFEVEDQGMGIPPEQRSRVFERFESRSQGSKHRGAGLGLSIVKSLVEAHGGDMRLDSEVGRGTRVTVRFPERGAARSLDGDAAMLPGRHAALAGSGSAA